MERDERILITDKDNVIHYVTCGTGDKPVLFIHGNLASSLWWEKTLSLMRARYRGYALDLPGSGKSPETGKRHTLECLTGFVHDFVSSLNLESFYLVGHSMGAGIAQLFTITWPEHVKKLVLVDSIPMDGFHGLLRRGEKWLHSLMEDRSLLEKAIQTVMPHCNDGKFFKEIIESAQGASEQVFVEQPVTMHEADWSDRIHKIDCPTLFIRGKDDTFIPKAGSERNAKAIKNCRLIYLDSCGHSPMVEIPEEFSEILFAFLEEE